MSTAHCCMLGDLELSPFHVSYIKAPSAPAIPYSQSPIGVLSYEMNKVECPVR